MANKVLAGARVLFGIVLENINGLVVLGGAGWLYCGVRGFSRPAADVVAGVVLMALGAFPYVWRTALLRKRKP